MYTAASPPMRQPYRNDRSPTRELAVGDHRVGGLVVADVGDAHRGPAGCGHPVPPKAGKGTTVPTSGELYGIALDASGEVLAVGHDLASSRTDDLGVTVLRLDSGERVAHRAVPDLPGAL